jgi:hypothetical protein
LDVLLRAEPEDGVSLKTDPGLLALAVARWVTGNSSPRGRWPRHVTGWRRPHSLVFPIRARSGGVPGSVAAISVAAIPASTGTTGHPSGDSFYRPKRSVAVAGEADLREEACHEDALLELAELRLGPLTAREGEGELGVAAS